MATTNTGKADTPETAASVLSSSAVVEDKMVEVELSGFLPERVAKRFGLERKSGYGPGDKIKIHRDHAASLISEGGVAVDPTDNAAVAKILGLKSR